MSFRVTLQTPDSQFLHALRETMTKELVGSHMNPPGRRALNAAWEFLEGAVKNVPLGTTIRAEVAGHFDTDGRGHITVKAELGQTLP